MQDTKEVNVFVCPGDVSIEKEIVRAVCISKSQSLQTNGSLVRFNVYDWKDIVSEIGNRPQEEINQRFGDYNIYLGILWMRFGSPIGSVKLRKVSVIKKATLLDSLLIAVILKTAPGIDDGSNMNKLYQLLPELFLRAPYYSVASYDLDWLPQVLEEQPFRNAIWLASPVFYKVLASKNFHYECLSDKEKFTLHKYYNRMCFRPTPFGSFASFTFLKWGNGSTIRLSDASRSVLHLLPDFELSITGYNSIQFQV